MSIDDAEFVFGKACPYWTLNQVFEFLAALKVSDLGGDRIEDILILVREFLYATPTDILFAVRKFDQTGKFY